ncbi:MAG: PilZ domain-containing protein [Deltaproteobacteria bacterium]|nr:PilZ domain-containing protein [Deltaproteobacteria bacterium]
MTQRPGILLIDDGELSGVACLLDQLGMEYTRFRGGDVAGRMPPPDDLLITTPRRADVVRRGSPPGARPGRPVRIIAVQEDSTAMRQMLRRMGFHLLVRLPCQESIWRLLVCRAVYQGDERRREDRVAVGSPVSIDHAGESGEAAGAVLLDVSNRGCRLSSSRPLPLDTQVSVVLGESATGGEPLTLQGSVVRAAPESLRRDGSGYQAAILFDADLDESQRARLGDVINRWSMGPPSLERIDPSSPSLPPCESAAIPGLVLDDETDPAIRIGESVALHVDSVPDGDAGADRRAHTRGAFWSPVMATTGPASRVLMGRDLSAGGMRVERLPDLGMGDELRLALHGTSQDQPFELTARVIRDDGEDGLALAFQDVPPAVAEMLEKLVACLPEVESLEESEPHGLGAILSEILDEE